MVILRRITLLAVSVLAIVSIVISPAFARDWNDDGWDDLDRAGKWGIEWDYGIDFKEDDFDWDDAECVVEESTTVASSRSGKSSSPAV